MKVQYHANNLISIVIFTYTFMLMIISLAIFPKCSSSMLLVKTCKQFM